MAAKIEDSETYFEIAKITKNTIAANNMAFGTKIKNTPSVVATAFPPLKFIKIENTCPKIAQIPTNT